VGVGVVTASVVSVERLTELERQLPDRIREAETAAAAKQKELIAMLVHRAAGVEVSEAELAKARTASAAAHQAAQDLREVAGALPDFLARARSLASVSRHQRPGVLERKAMKQAYLSALYALRNTSFRGLSREEAKRQGKALLELARRAGKVQDAKQKLTELGEKNGPSKWLLELV
jgi:hypothetical protein